MECPKCLKQTPPGFRFCGHCGAALPEQSELPPPSPSDGPRPAATAPAAEGSSEASSDGGHWKLALLVVLVIILGFLKVPSFFDQHDESGGMSNAARESWARAEKLQQSSPQGRNRSEKLDLLSSSSSRRASYIVVEGEIKNISAEPLDNVDAVATFYDDTGKFVTSDSALIEYRPLLAGQTSPFKVAARWNPAISKWKVDFKYFNGAKIPTRK